MWSISLFASVAVHLIVLLAIGAKNGEQVEAPAKVFSLVSLSAPQLAAEPSGNIARRSEPVLDSDRPPAESQRASDRRGVMSSEHKVVAIEQRGAQYYSSSEVSHLAQLQLPLEGIQFSDELTLSGRLILDIAVSDTGKVVSIEVVEASDASGLLRARMLPLLRSAPFSPAYKDGRPVNSVRRVEFTLGIVSDDPTLGFNSSVSPGFRPQMDERGNILKNQPKQ